MRRDRKRHHRRGLEYERGVVDETGLSRTSGRRTEQERRAPRRQYPAPVANRSLLPGCRQLGVALALTTVPGVVVVLNQLQIEVCARRIRTHPDRGRIAAAADRRHLRGLEPTPTGAPRPRIAARMPTKNLGEPRSQPAGGARL